MSSLVWPAVDACDLFWRLGPGVAMADDGTRITARSGANAPVRRYAAFISYSHADEEVANWLHRSLETYHIPSALAPNGKRRLGKIFRDRVELSAAHDLGGEIRKALDLSDALIVVCSPRSARSQYVAEEIRYFKVRAGAGRIFAVIVSGEPHAAGKPGRTADEECFPRALLYQIDENDGISSSPESNEPIAADLREGKDGRESGVLKLIAGLLGVGLDELVQREKLAERARRRRIQLVAAVMAVLAVGAAVAGGVAVWQRDVAEKQTREASHQRDRARTNEERALKGEADAVANFDEAQRQRLEAERAATEREVQRALAEANAAEATANEQQARDTLHRFLATRAWEKIDQLDSLAAARYALAGLKLSPANREEYRAVLGAVMYRVGESGPPLEHGDDYLRGAVISPDGQRIATFGEETFVRIWGVRGEPLLSLVGGHTESLSRVSFSPDGKRLVSIDDGGIAAVWRADTGALLRRFKAQANIWKRPTAAVFSPDGAQIATAGGDRVSRIWNATTGELVVELSEESGSVSEIRYFPDGARLLTRSADHTITTWNALTGRPIVTIKLMESAQEHGFSKAILSPDSSSILTLDVMHGIRAWNANSGAHLFTLEGHKGGSSHAIYTRDGKKIITAGADNLARFWDARDGKLLGEAAGSTNGLSYLALSADEGLLVTLSGEVMTVSPESNVARVWQIPGNNLLRAFGVQRDMFVSLDFYPIGATLVTAAGKSARIWDMSKRFVPTIVTTPEERVLVSALTPGGKRLVTVSQRESDEVIRVWDLETGAQLMELGQGIETDAEVVVSQNGSRVAMTMYDGSVRVWETQSGRLVLDLPTRTNLDGVDLSHDGKRLAIAWDGAVGVWNLDDGRPVLETPRTANTDYWHVLGVKLSPDGRGVAYLNGDGELQIWNLSTGRLVANVKADPEGGGLSFSPDGARVMLPTESGRVQMWSARTGQGLGVINVPDANGQSVAFSPDGRLVVTASAHNPARVWDVGTGRLVATLSVEGVSTSTAHFSPDGTRIVTAGDNRIGVWDAMSGRLITSLVGHKAVTEDAAFSPDGAYVISSAADATARVWAVHRLTQSVEGGLVRDVCVNLLGIQGRQFSQQEIDADPLLRSEWPDPARDVCAGIEGVSPLVQIQPLAPRIAIPETR